MDSVYRWMDGEEERDVWARPEGGAGLNYASVAHQSPGWPMASTSFSPLGLGIIRRCIFFVRRISLTD